MNSIIIPDKFLEPEQTTHESSFCKVVRNETVTSLLAAAYGRPDLCLKIFKTPANGLTVKTFKWGGTPLWDCTVAQNLFAFQGMAPRVFDVIRVGNHLAQVTPFIPVGNRPPPEIVSRLRKQLDRYPIWTHKNYWDVNHRNWRGDLFVDFSGFYFREPLAYEADLVRQAYTRRGEYIGTAYQPVPEMNINGTREMESRLAAMRLDEIDFVGKSVLDIGCNLGYLCRWAREQGARRVVGIDRIAHLTYEIGNWLGDWQTDYLHLRLPEEAGEISFRSGIEKFDIVIATAVVKHIGGLAPWLVEYVKDVFIFEGHGSIEETVYEPQLKKYFGTVGYFGQTTDNYKRHLFRCRI